MRNGGSVLFAGRRAFAAGDSGPVEALRRRSLKAQTVHKPAWSGVVDCGVAAWEPFFVVFGGASEGWCLAVDPAMV